MLSTQNGCGLLTNVGASVFSFSLPCCVYVFRAAKSSEVDLTRCCLFYVHCGAWACLTQAVQGNTASNRNAQGRKHFREGGTYSAGETVETAFKGSSPCNPAAGFFSPEVEPAGRG